MKAGSTPMRARDADALALAAGELARIAVHHVRREADAGRAVAHRVAALRRAAHEPLRIERLGDDVHHRAARAERAVRVLEMIWTCRRMSCISRASARRCRCHEKDAPGGRLDEPKQQASCRRLAASGLAHERQRLARRNLEADVVDRLHAWPGLCEQAAAASRREGFVRPSTWSRGAVMPRPRRQRHSRRADWPRPRSNSGGFAVRHTGTARAAVVEIAARATVLGRWDGAWDLVEPLARYCRCWGSNGATPPCRGARDVRRSWRYRPSLTTRPHTSRERGRRCRRSRRDHARSARSPCAVARAAA